MTDAQKMPTPEAPTDEGFHPKDDNLPPVTYEDRHKRTSEIYTSANLWINQCAEITSEAQAERANDLLVLINGADNTNDKTRLEITSPWRDQTTKTNSKFSTLAAYLDKSKTAIKKLLKPWLEKKEADLLAKEKAQRDEAAKLEREAEEKRAEAERLEAANKIEDEIPSPGAEPADPIGAQVAADEADKKAADATALANQTARQSSSVKGELGVKGTGLRKPWKATEITDLDKAIEYYKERPEISELLLRIANTEISDKHKQRRKIPGFKIEQVTSI